jgi:S1-C subfamily serine protease
VFCPKCGTEHPDDSQFCRKCGRSLTATVPSTPPARSRAIPMALAVGVVLLIVVAWVINNSRQKNISRAVSAESIQSSATPVVDTATTTPASAASPASLSPEEIYKAESAGMILIEIYDDQGRKRAFGSGFVVASDGTTITNYHVIRGASRATVKFADGTVGSIEGVESYDQNRDLAVVQVMPAPKAFLEIGDSDRMRVGDKVVAVGSPLGLQNTMSEGIVSGLRNGVIQISAPISPGSSGGAVFDEHGKVIGVSSAQMVAGQNLNFAIPINWAKPYLSGQSPRPLSEVAAENTVTQNVIDGSVTIPPRQARTWNIAVNRNSMSNAEVSGQISATGGSDGKITLMLAYEGRPIFSCRERDCEIHQAIANPGVYTLVLDNRISPIFARAVTGQIALKYVK